MLHRTLARRFAHLVREVDTAGFAGDFRMRHHVNAASTQARAREAMQSGGNVLFCGHHGTGKLNLLRAIGEQCEKKGHRVAYVSADNKRAARLDAYLVNYFIGLRPSADELPSQEQLEGTLERHVRLVESTYASSLPSLCSVDVLIFDALHKVPPTVLLSMDAVARRLRGQPGTPFGGLRVYAAADFWQLSVQPSSDTGGYLFQLQQWDELFPLQKLLRRSYVQTDKDLQRFTELAFDGGLTLAHMKELEARSIAGKPEAQLMSWSSSTTEAERRLSRERDDEDDDDVDEEAGEGDGEMEDVMSLAQWSRHPAGAAGLSPPPSSLRPPHGGSDAALPPPSSFPLSASADAPSRLGLLNDEMNSSSLVCTTMLTRFPRQPAVKVLPTRSRQLRAVEMGSFLLSALAMSSTAVALNLFDSLSIDVGARVHLTLDGPEHFGVPGGAVGEVMQVRPHFISVHFPRDHRTLDIPRMRVTTYHPLYPEIRCELRQFPLFPRQRICPMSIVRYSNTYFTNLNGRRMADTNNLGNVLARQRSFADFTIRNTSDFANLDGMVHEPTRIYYHKISGRPITAAREQWCRNCKQFVETDKFFAHWQACVQAVRWCPLCNTAVPLELLEPHKEKHQVVLCLDCGRPVEWRHWEAHRLSCGPMMREVSVDNQFLPLRTRQLALEMGLDKRDLHTMPSISRTTLVRSRVRLDKPGTL